MTERITVRVTPRAKHQMVREVSVHEYAIAVIEPPEKGRATDAARRALAMHLNIAPSRVSLVMGAAARTKIFEVR